ncbi:MAG: response regulator [Gemmatimonadales bacterium]|nr:response regulator [Gemmatimonadales bacterium]
MPDIRALIVDDEPLARKSLRNRLAPHADVRVVGECGNAREALEALETLVPDLVFLDVQMPEVGGFELIERFGPQRMPAVVFVTAFDDFALRAFDVRAVDYLLKPISPKRFDEALDRVRAVVRRSEAAAVSQRLADLLSTEREERPTERAVGSSKARIVLHRPDGVVVLHAEDIDWIRAADYCAAVHAGGKRYVVRESLASLAARFEGAGLFRVHRSAMVNVSRVQSLATAADGEPLLVLRDGTKIPISRRRRQQLVERLRGDAP